MSNKQVKPGRVRFEDSDKRGILELEITESHIVMRRYFKLDRGGVTQNGQTMAIFANELDWFLEQLTKSRREL